ncbi:DUF3667 domain-containing protein [Myroides sp. WP-1]|uniref:DUF3667 domain-containing protein n=1 Tax=Myroides sp. WP-1 TaxID=2759944 RepID=UPI0015FBCE52|nr:DUF3667 domain-containing protein [Myroides sp. WP-1]MBB1139233.1 DUF3667 domain-containing protein [Myroides sp. WP-1]
MAHCLSCNLEESGKFCSNCGQSLSIERIDRKYAIQELMKLTGYEKGFVYTVIALALRPGKVIRQYLDEDRQRITQPITFLILTSLIYTVVGHYFKSDLIHTGMMKTMYGDSYIFKLSFWVQQNYGYANLLMLVPITFWTRLLFNEHKYNTYETFVVTSLIMAEGMLLYTLQVALNFVFPKAILLNEFITAVVLFFYVGWAIGRFYGGTRRSYWKGFFSYLLGVITFQILIVVFGVLADIIIKL